MLRSIAIYLTLRELRGLLCVFSEDSEGEERTDPAPCPGAGFFVSGVLSGFVALIGRLPKCSFSSAGGCLRELGSDCRGSGGDGCVYLRRVARYDCLSGSCFGRARRCIGSGGRRNAFRDPWSLLCPCGSATQHRLGKVLSFEAGLGKPTPQFLLMCPWQGELAHPSPKDLRAV
jgi:hypothetical protein